MHMTIHSTDYDLCLLSTLILDVLFLTIQQGDDGRLRMSHKSIKDFFFNKTRSCELYANFEAEQTIMAQRCLEILTTELRRDPCQYGIMFYLLKISGWINFTEKC